MVMERLQIESVLSKHLPKKALPDVVNLLIRHKVYLNITKSRSSKYGDFKVPRLGLQPKLSINHNLNPYAFLITLLHEIAHLLVWKKYQANFRIIKPHGIEWKFEFKNLMEPFLKECIFPEPLLTILKRHMLNPKASSSTDVNLARELKQHDNSPSHITILSDLQIGDIFQFKGSIYRIIRKNRTRFLCEDMDARKRYLIHSLAEIEIP